jgi:hypothetical protein
MATSAATPPTSGYVTWVRYAMVIVAWLFVAGGLVQLFLAGLSVFDPADAVAHWQDHTDFGRMLGFLAYLLPILALIGRVGMPRIGHAVVIAILFVVQSFLSNVDTDWVAALHPVNGFLLLGSAIGLGTRMLAMVRPRS